ncbi:MAG: dTDP-4-dehydrorhamnose reductase [Rhodanobacteraceae bacterium]
MKILLLGAKGQVGDALREVLAEAGDLTCATRDGKLGNGAACIAADLSDPQSLAAALEHGNPEILVNAAAYTAVDRAEDESDLADRVNHRAVGEIGAWASRRGATVVHYSTDYVFDGRATRPYREQDATGPLGVYGRSKLAGEEALTRSGAAHLILRTAWVYSTRGHNFLRTILRLADEREELRIVSDQIGAPTPASLIAATTATMLAQWRSLGDDQRHDLSGIWHLTAAGQCSWFEFANAIVDEAHSVGVIARAPRVLPISTADYPTRARRPAYSVLDCGKLEKAFAVDFPNWRPSLQRSIAKLAGETS